MQAVHDIFKIWPSLSAMSVDVNRRYDAVCKWKQRERIPPEAWDAVILGAKKRGKKLDYAILSRLTSPRLSARGAPAA